MQHSAELPRVADYVARECEEDWQVHAYAKADLADPEIGFLIPYCSPDWRYPVRHERSAINSHARQLRGMHACSACSWFLLSREGGEHRWAGG